MTTSTQSELDTFEPSLLQFLVPAAILALDVVLALSGASSQTVWYLIRASGIVAYLVLTLSVVTGLLITTKAVSSLLPRDLYEAHSFASLLVIGIASFHVVALLFDNYVGFSPLQVLVPFTSSYRPLAVAFGILTLYLTVVVYASFWFRKRIGYKTWRTLHYSTFGLFVFATIHGLASGADSSSLWATGMYLGATAVVILLSSFRLISTSGPAKA